MRSMQKDLRKWISGSTWSCRHAYFCSALSISLCHNLQVHQYFKLNESTVAQVPICRVKYCHIAVIWRLYILFVHSSLLFNNSSFWRSAHLKFSCWNHHIPVFSRFWNASILINLTKINYQLWNKKVVVILWFKIIWAHLTFCLLVWQNEKLKHINIWRN